MAKVLFLDTNIYLHYHDIEQINWLEIAQTDAVAIIIPPVTIRELNRAKDSPQYRSRIRKRAAATLKKLNGLFQSSFQVTIRDGVAAQLESRDPSIDFGQYCLRGFSRTHRG